jgi:hypothetical protein
MFAYTVALTVWFHKALAEYALLIGSNRKRVRVRVELYTWALKAHMETMQSCVFLGNKISIVVLFAGPDFRTSKLNGSHPTDSMLPAESYAECMLRKVKDQAIEHDLEFKAI